MCKINKFLFLLLIILVILLFPNFSFAISVSTNTEYFENNSTLNFPDLSEEYTNLLNSNPYIFLSYNNKYYRFLILQDDSYFYKSGDSLKLEGNYYLAYTTGSTWTYDQDNGYGTSWDFNTIFYYNADVFTDVNKTDYYFKVSDNKILPEILDTDDNLRLLNMTNLLIDTGNINIKEGYFDFFIRTKSLGSSDDFFTVYHAKLDKNSSFYKTGGINGDYYEIPVDTFKNLLTKGNLISYDLMWLEEDKDISETVSRSVIFGYESTETNDILNNNFKNLFNLITKQALEEVALSQKQHEESQETQKGILATIKEVVSYINPFSENFFVYKLIDLLIEALKNLFIPGDEFFSNYFNELKEWFSNRFGFLAYPLDLILDILNRILNINFTEPAFNIPEIKEPITNTNLISATSFNFNTLLENETLKTVHDTYLILVDAVIIFALVNLAKTKFEEVMTK